MGSMARPDMYCKYRMVKDTNVYIGELIIVLHFGCELISAMHYYSPVREWFS